MRRGFSLSSIRADIDRQMYPEQYKAAQQAAALLVTPTYDASTLPPLQQAALIQMTESHVKRALMARLMEDSQDGPGVADYAALARLNLARFRSGKRLHELTDEGRSAAKALIPKLCIALDVHLMQGPSGCGTEVTFSCPCGWRVSVRNSNTAPGNARASFNRHHATQAGMNKIAAALKPVRMMEG